MDRHLQTEELRRSDISVITYLLMSPRWGSLAIDATSYRASAKSYFRLPKHACAKERRSPGRRRGIAGAEPTADPEITFGNRYRKFGAPVDQVSAPSLSHRGRG